MTAGHHQAQEGGLQIREGQVVGGDMAPDVMHRNQGNIQRHGRGLGEVHTHQHRADEARGIGHRHSVNILPGQSRLGQRLIGKAIDGLDVLAAGDLRHHAAIFPVKGHLGGDAVAKNLPSILYDGHGSLVTARFHSQNVHFFTSNIYRRDRPPGRSGKEI